MLWMYEKDWLLSMLKGYNDRDKPSILDSYLNEYSLAGLSQFEAQDSIPVTLKALLFNRYAKQSHSLISAAEGFKEFYKKYIGARYEKIILPAYELAMTHVETVCLLEKQ